jgi:endonuclease/exonuclease/phosphatase family metal-dependent hydrolase
MPKIIIADESKLQFILISFNIGEGGSKRVFERTNHSYSKDDMKTALREIANLIKMTKADIAALQEIDRHKRRSRGLNEPEEIVKELEENWQQHFFKAVSRREAEYGNAIFSRFKLKTIKDWPLGKAEGSNGEDRVAICFQYHIKHEEKSFKFWVINVHLGLSREDQLHQLGRLKEIIGSTSFKKPIILCGDFNVIENPADPGSGIQYEELCEILKNIVNINNNERDPNNRRSFIDLGPKNGVTFPRGRKKIDYIFFSNTTDSLLKESEVEIIPAAECSDHDALKATFTLYK